MKKIAVVNDLSGLGKCSLTAAIPVISVMGVQACPFPTAVLSNQTGYDTYFCEDFTDHMEPYMEQWKKRDFVPDGIYTGFLSDEKQADKILKLMDTFAGEDTLILTDPVMGDDGEVYPIYTKALRNRFCELVRRSYVITPNLTEALILLYGKEKMEAIWREFQEISGRERLDQIEETGRRLAEEFSLSAVVITGVDYREGEELVKIGNLVLEKEKSSWVFAEKSGGSYSGTGDLFASVLSAGLVKGYSMKKCAHLAVDFISASIRDAVEEGTDRNDGVCFEAHLGRLIQ
ncbi:MAG: pyridoxamine kinase [Blautia sp.]|nr:pyridoxamine kinase [Blautia sp.]